ncbi:hypothetical protein U27_01527 [Candidatus Vecturithrix granuli]|uniref:Zinc-finger domain-containing protein n=1 Tax=Vecturithrix granuli TaxID=1499967 RepID=A0A081CAM1_VECG1|nr:hypothetical protein U27_01527 [Candidatus Vecturithrix granuli]
MNAREHDPAHEAFQCVDPEQGSAWLYGYAADTLAAEERQAFEDHLCFCLKCQEDLEWLRELLHSLQASPPVSLRVTLTRLIQQGIAPAEGLEFFFQLYERCPLPVTAIEDGNQMPLLTEYQEMPLFERLAASTESSDLAFPLTVTYLNGAIIGQFRRRAGQLFFRLQSESLTDQALACVLQYPSPLEPETVASLTVRPGEEKRLGPFRAFAPSNTMQEMLTTLKRFELRLAASE